MLCDECMRTFALSDIFRHSMVHGWLSMVEWLAGMREHVSFQIGHGGASVLETGTSPAVDTG